MSDCLVTTLRAAVTDDGTFRKIGELRVGVEQVDNPDYGASGTQRIVITSSAAQTISCLTGGSFVDGSGVETSPTSVLSANTQKTLICKNADYQISIPDKYSLTYIKLFSSLSINIDELEMSTSLTSLLSGSSKTCGDLYNLRNTLLSGNLELNDTSVTGNIKHIPATCAYMSCTRTNIYGDISDLARCVNITRISVAYCTRVYGTLEGFATAQIAAGRTSGSVQCYFQGTGITYNGLKLTGIKTITYSGGSYSVS